MYGFIEDSLPLLIASYVQMEEIAPSEPLFIKIFFFISNFIDSIFLYNSLIIIGLFLNFYFTFKFLNLFIPKKLAISIVVSIVFVLSPYFYYKSMSHIALFQVWFLQIYLIKFFNTYLVEKSLWSRKNYIILGLILALLGLFSNYLAFFAILFTLVFSFFFILKNKLFNFKIFINNFLLFFTFLIIFSVFNYNFILSNFGLFPEQINTQSLDSYILKRSESDFFIFSSRPWYYFLSSVDNPFLGNITKDLLEKNQERFLFQNYFKSEHSASYIGLFNILFSLIGIFYVLKKLPNTSFKNLLKVVLITLIVLILFSMPPYINFWGIKLYFPSYIISEYFSMFRVLARLGVLTLMLILIFTALGLNAVFEKIKNKFLKYFFLMLYLIFTLSEFFIPIKITNISEKPEVYNYMADNIKTSNFLVYPHSKTKEALFWTKDQDNNLINKYNSKIFFSDNSFIESSRLTENIFTCEGIRDSIKLGAKYLIVLGYSDLEVTKKDFLATYLYRKQVFSRVTTSDETTYLLLRVINIGNNPSNTSAIYIFPDKINCDGSSF